MISQPVNEKWKSFERLALESLRGSGRVLRGVGMFKRVFQVVIIPFDLAPRAYSFSVRNDTLDGTSFYCVRTIWDREYDRKRFESGLRTGLDVEPSFDGSLIKLTEEFAKPVQEALAKLSVPLFVESTVQLDGSSYEFANDRVRVSWGETVPDAWTPLAEILRDYCISVEDLAKSNQVKS